MKNKGVFLANGRKRLIENLNRQLMAQVDTAFSEISSGDYTMQTAINIDLLRKRIKILSGKGYLLKKNS